MTGRTRKFGKGAALAATLSCALSIAALPARAGAAPARVVSINLCTDQLAMLIADKGQLLSVSAIARDPHSSAMTREASAFPVNHGQAEEIFLLKPDLVLAGTYTARATVGLLRGLDIRVEQFVPDTSFEDVKASIRRMGTLLGREARAEELSRRIDAELERTSRLPRSGKLAALYYANSYTSGAGTLAHAVIEAAGLENLAARLGIRGTASIPLEALVMAMPDVVVAGDRDYEPPALAQENFSHPAFRALIEHSGEVAMPVRNTVCGGPFTLAAVRMLRAAAGQDHVRR
ncbi:ABC transporter substrate-binding protein [Rhizobiaceae bacterium BDR2-2]|uniref:ABC transporter substrate-binding protein n=1 Tax=Ectorhizobium quercum TaxID=2965071 RepID=A0AAE3N3I8_9HYPH|nr:ABC transporter substrate-binding protein [Ectorhizobium quercum]MCX8999551.1 ABC transporter substrate-binding protein [Ectorhizobium quercum]